MLYILGAGHSHPSGVVSRENLLAIASKEAASWLTTRTTFESRPTILSTEYILASGNEDPWFSKDNLTATPSDLAVEAANLALKRAGIVPSQVGLVIGDSPTPLETTPSEGQRVAKRLDLRCPAFDISHSANSFVLHLDVLSGFDEEKVPEYVLCVSANTPTTRVNFRKGVECCVFGDCATAMVVSTKNPGSIGVLSSSVYRDKGPMPELSIGAYGHIKMDWKSKRVLLKKIALNLCESIPPNSVFIGSQIDDLIQQEIANELRSSVKESWHNFETKGYSLGSSAASVFSEHWEEAINGDPLFVMEIGTDGSYGFVAIGGV